MTIRRLFLFTCFGLTYLILFNNIANGQQFFWFPIDNDGWVDVQAIGNIVELTGTWDKDTPPDWKNLIDHTLLTCATFRLMESWDCGNPERHNTRSLFFYFRFEVGFPPPKCEQTICVWAKGHDEYGQVCIDNRYPQYTSSTKLRDMCGNDVRQRGTGFIDIDENIYPEATLQSATKTEFPNCIYGHFYSAGSDAWTIPMEWVGGDTLHAVYKGDTWTVWLWLHGDTLGESRDIRFTVPYGHCASAQASVKQVKFDVQEVFFQDTLDIYEYLPYTACFPHCSMMKFGTCVQIDGHYPNWPPDCQSVENEIKAYVQGTDSLLVTTRTDRITSPGFTTYFDGSNYEINGYQYDQIPIDWKGTVGINSNYERAVGPDAPPITLHIFEAFKADSISFTEHPSAIFIGDTVEIRAFPCPVLKTQDRILYSWELDKPNMAHLRVGEFGGFMQYPINYLCIDSAGDFQVRFTVKDTADGHEFSTTSQYKAVHVGAKLVITSPKKDTTYWISEKPEMPQIKCRAQIAGLDTASQRDFDFYWKMVVKHNKDSLVIRDTVAGVHDWIPNWGTTFMGDFVTLDAGVKYGADSLVAHIVHNDSLRILGKNPMEDTAIAYLKSKYPNDQDKARQMVVIAEKESGYRQFYGQGDSVKLRGLPVENTSSNGTSSNTGVGMMQITFFSTQRLADSLYWNWHANADSGKGILDNKWTSSVSWFNQRIKQGWPAPVDSNKLYDTYCRYNGGLYYTAIDLDTLKYFARDTMYMDSCGYCKSGQPEFDRHKTLGCKQSGCCYSDRAMILHRQH